MIALDTNVVVRLIVNDDARQVAAARRLLDQNILLLTTVVMETEWVLRKTYKLSRDRIISSIETMCGLPQVSLLEPDVIEAALDLYVMGLDLADALHLCSMPHPAKMATFDVDLEIGARKHFGPGRVIIPGR